MKAIKSILVMALIAVTSLTSCKKENMPPIGVGVHNNPDGSWSVGLSIGGGTGIGWNLGYIPYGTNVSTVLIMSKPTDQANIPVFDMQKQQFCIVDCSTGDPKSCQAFFRAIQDWFATHTGPCYVNVMWDPSWTHIQIGNQSFPTPASGHIKS